MQTHTPASWSSARFDEPNVNCFHSGCDTWKFCRHSLSSEPRRNFKSIWIIDLLGKTIAKHSSWCPSLSRQLTRSWDSSELFETFTCIVWQWQFRAWLAAIKWSIKHRPIKCKITIFRDRADCRRDGDRYQKAAVNRRRLHECDRRIQWLNCGSLENSPSSADNLASIISKIWSFSKVESQVDVNRRPIARWIIMTSWVSCGQRKGERNFARSTKKWKRDYLFKMCFDELNVCSMCAQKFF